MLKTRFQALSSLWSLLSDSPLHDRSYILNFGQTGTADRTVHDAHLESMKAHVADNALDGLPHLLGSGTAHGLFPKSELKCVSPSSCPCEIRVNVKVMHVLLPVSYRF